MSLKKLVRRKINQINQTLEEKELHWLRKKSGKKVELSSVPFKYSAHVFLPGERTWKEQMKYYNLKHMFLQNSPEFQKVKLQARFFRNPYYFKNWTWAILLM